MKTWLISDTHFYHNKMIELCGRPENFTELLMSNWNSMIDKSDTVIHLGDVAWISNFDIGYLNGRKILVKGNHDKQSYSWYMNHGFDFACQSFGMFIGGLEIIFTHKPITTIDNIVNIHGHLHNTNHHDISNGNHYCIAVENTGYKPILLSDLLPKLRSWIK